MPLQGEDLEQKWENHTSENTKITKMGGTKRRMKTKWRKVSLAELSESLASVSKQTDVKQPENASAAESMCKGQETQTEFATYENNEEEIISEESCSEYMNGYDYPPGIMYPSPPYFYINRMGLPVYPNFVIPSDIMYRPYYAPPPTDMTSATPVQEYNPSMQVPVGQGYNLAMQAPPGQEYNPSMQAPAGQGYNILMEAQPGQEYNPMQAPAGEGYNPMQAPAGEGYNPMQAPAGQGYNLLMQAPPGQEYIPSMQAPAGQGYNFSMQAQPGRVYNPSMQAPPGQEYIPSMPTPPGHEYNPLMHIPPVQEYNPMQYQAPHAKDPVILFFPGAPVYPSQAHCPPLTYDWRNRRRRWQYGRYGDGSFLANRNQQFGNEEERYGSTVLRTNRKSGASGNLTSHGNTMSSVANSSYREGQKRKEETEEKRSFPQEDRSKGQRNMGSSNAERNGNGKGQMNLKYIRKTEFCETHTGKTQEKGDSTNEGQEKSTGSVKNPQRNSNKEIFKNKKITILQSEGGSSKRDSNDENKTMPKPVNDSMEGVFNGNEIADFTKQVSKNADITTSQSKTASFEENFNCKGTVNSQAAPVEGGDIEEAEAVEGFNKNAPKNKIRPIKINDNERNAFGSVAEHSPQDNERELQKIKKSNLGLENVAEDKNVAADENISEDKNVAANEKVAAPRTVAKHSSPDNDKEMHEIKKSNLYYENVPAHENVAANGNNATAGTVTEHSAPDIDKELQGIDKHNIDLKTVEVDENVAEDKSNSSNSNIYAMKEKEEQQNRLRSPYPNSLGIVPEIANTVPKALSTVLEVSIPEFGESSAAKPTGIITSEEKSPVNEKCLKSKSSFMPIEVNPKQDFIVPDILRPVPKMSNLIPETAVSATNDTYPEKSHGVIQSAKNNQLDEKAMKPSSVLHLSNNESFNSKTDVELKQLTSFQSMKHNQLIYKLAYNESITSSETNSRSLSSVDSEIYIPSSLINDEINVHAADSDSDAGSEDIELIPHRYESETFLNRNKNVYINKLSLAVELLRTQESLPYDDHFKRVVDDDAFAEDTAGEVNFGFEEDSTLFNTSRGPNNNTTSNSGQVVVVTRPGKSNNLPAISGVASSAANSDDFNDSCEEAEERTVARSLKNRICTMCSLS